MCVTVLCVGCSYTLLCNMLSSSLCVFQHMKADVAHHCDVFVIIVSSDFTV